MRSRARSLIPNRSTKNFSGWASSFVMFVVASLRLGYQTRTSVRSWHRRRAREWKGLRRRDETRQESAKEADSEARAEANLRAGLLSALFWKDQPAAARRLSWC